MKTEKLQAYKLNADPACSKLSIYSPKQLGIHALCIIHEETLFEIIHPSQVKKLQAGGYDFTGNLQTILNKAIKYPNPASAK